MADQNYTCTNWAVLNIEPEKAARSNKVLAFVGVSHKSKQSSSQCSQCCMKGTRGQSARQEHTVHFNFYSQCKNWGFSVMIVHFRWRKLPDKDECLSFPFLQVMHSARISVSLSRSLVCFELCSHLPEAAWAAFPVKLLCTELSVSGFYPQWVSTSNQLGTDVGSEWILC